jgi:NAD(P)-dependent dehydrogenase (short-subunit alcohol dehydrogenase family)
MGKLNGKIAIVTGAGQGVGRGIALALAKEGATLMVVGRTLEKCVRTVDEITALGGRAKAMACDTSQRDQVNAVVAAAVKDFDTIDILVNNAQDARTGIPFDQVTDDDMDMALGSGFYGTFYFMQACFPHFKEKGGKVINFGSASGTSGNAGFAAYAAAKEGIRALTRVAAREWAKLGITVNTICPLANSPGVQQWVDSAPEISQQILAGVPMGRIGDCETDIGRAALFLASSDADYITGQTLNVDGGALIAP